MMSFSEQLYKQRWKQEPMTQADEEVTADLAVSKKVSNIPRNRQETVLLRGLHKM
jgi:hypothetical protein